MEDFINNIKKAGKDNHWDETLINKLIEQIQDMQW